MEQAPVDLDADPLSGVLERAVQHCGTGAVGHRPRVLGHLERDDLAPLHGVSDHFELRRQRLVLGDVVELVADAAWLVPRSPDVEAVRGLLRRELLDREAVLQLLDVEVNALSREASLLRGGQDDVELQPGRRLSIRDDVVPAANDLARLGAIDLRRVDLVQVLAARRRCASRTHGDKRQRARQCDPAPHRPSPIGA
jgi:hypothetical protein